MKSILSLYWSAEQSLVNFGDFLNVPVWGYLGCSYEDVRTIASDRLALYPACVHAIGSCICENFRLLSRDKRIVVWGAGTFEGDGLSRDALTSQYDFRCVRGPLTRQLLGLPENTPLGDPALLLRRYVPRPALSMPNSERRAVLSIPHFEHQSHLPARERMEREGADELINIWIERARWLEVVRAIANAQFVLTSSLHGAIVAQAFDTPWAVTLHEGERLNKPLKWQDWAAYLGITITPVTNLAEGKVWWEREGSKGRVQSLDQIEESFPWDCAIELT